MSKESWAASFTGGVGSCVDRELVGGIRGDGSVC